MWRFLFDWLRRGAKSRAVRRGAIFLARGGQAASHARKVHGKVGVRIIGNDPHWVVWLDGTFAAVFPEASPKPDLDTYLKRKVVEGDDVEKWLFDPAEVEKALREFTKWRRRRGNGDPPPALEE